jgi:molybdopterin-biosynthesis enzyme MoeA-like protein
MADGQRVAAAILIGDEILLGTQDTNTAYIARWLGNWHPVREVRVVG